MFTFEQVGGLVRHALTTLGGFAVAKGWVDPDSMMEVVGAVMTLIGVGWSWAIKPKATP